MDKNKYIINNFNTSLSSKKESHSKYGHDLRKWWCNQIQEKLSSKGCDLGFNSQVNLAVIAFELHTVKSLIWDSYLRMSPVQKEIKITPSLSSGECLVFTPDLVKKQNQKSIYVCIEYNLNYSLVMVIIKPKTPFIKRSLKGIQGEEKQGRKNSFTVAEISQNKICLFISQFKRCERDS